MAAEATAGRFRAASPASGRVALGAAGLTVAMFGVCGVLLLLTRDYQRAAYGAGGTVAALVVTAFAARLQDAVDLGTVRDELANVVHAALEPDHLSVWIKEP